MVQSHRQKKTIWDVIARGCAEQSIPTKSMRRRDVSVEKPCFQIYFVLIVTLMVFSLQIQIQIHIVYCL